MLELDGDEVRVAPGERISQVTLVDSPLILFV